PHPADNPSPVGEKGLQKGTARMNRFLLYGLGLAAGPVLALSLITLGCVGGVKFEEANSLPGGRAEVSYSQPESAQKDVKATPPSIPRRYQDRFLKIAQSYESYGRTFEGMRLTGVICAFLPNGFVSGL